MERKDGTVRVHRTLTGQEGTVLSYCSVAHIVFAVVLVDGKFESWPINELIQGEESDRGTSKSGTVATTGSAGANSNTRADGPVTGGPTPKA